MGSTFYYKTTLHKTRVDMIFSRMLADEVWCPSEEETNEEEDL